MIEHFQQDFFIGNVLSTFRRTFFRDMGTVFSKLGGNIAYSIFGCLGSVMDHTILKPDSRSGA